MPVDERLDLPGIGHIGWVRVADISPDKQQPGVEPLPAQQSQALD